MKAKMIVTTEIRTFSHTLEESPFCIFMREEMATRIFDVRSDSFRVAVRVTEEQHKQCKGDDLGFGFVVSSNLLIGMNIATLGHFIWANGTTLAIHCERHHTSGKREKVTLHAKEPEYPVERRKIEESEVKNALLISASLMADRDQTFRREYLKGIIHFGLQLGDIDFRREAFANFYRSFEYFMTSRVLKKKKLGNEFQELSVGIRAIGLPSEFCDEFKTLYKKRSEQVMHAQREPKPVTSEDVVRIKCFTDYSLHRYYRAQADAWLKQRRGQAEKGA